MIKWLLFLFPLSVFGQSYAPAAGQPGSTAVHRDSSVITHWAENVFIDRGYLDIADPNLGYTSHGVAQDAEGPANGSSVVSLGDGGVATYYFSIPLSDGPGPDFAVFENGFIDHYIELAFVEVSSDNQNYVRFDAISEIQTDVQLTNFDTVNCGYVHNFAGKYRANYGVPFDLNELSGVQGVDIFAITSIRIVDAIGSISPTFASFDSQGQIVNDPYPTPFASGGFDLDGLAILQPYWLGTDDLEELKLSCYPNPATDVLRIEGATQWTITDVFGRFVRRSESEIVDVSNWEMGTYFIEAQVGNKVMRTQFVKL